jgi:GNAT superfamily N-acetyltransferase
MQRKGIATKLLNAVCEDAKECGYNFVEAYHGSNKDGSPSSHGNFSMYTKQGFKLIESDSGNKIMRKKL